MLGKIQNGLLSLLFYRSEPGAWCVFLTEAKIGIPVPVAQILSRWGVLPQQASSSLEEVVTLPTIAGFIQPGVIEAINATAAAVVGAAGYRC